jgi:hypothetical protein
MIEGILTVNLEPPYLSFQSTAGLAGEDSLRNCTTEEIRSALAEFCAIEYCQNWPLKECIVRIQGNFCREKLVSFGLLPLHIASSLPKPKRILMKVAQ